MPWTPKALHTYTDTYFHLGWSRYVTHIEHPYIKKIVEVWCSKTLFLVKSCYLQLFQVLSDLFVA